MAVSNGKKSPTNGSIVAAASRSKSRGFCMCVSGFIFGVSLTVLSMSMSSSAGSGCFDSLNANLLAVAQMDPRPTNVGPSSSAVDGATTEVTNKPVVTTPNATVETSKSSTTVEAAKESTTSSTTTSTSKYSWPGVPQEKLGVPLVKIGHNFVDNARELLLDHWEEFLAVYADRPDKVNMCGIRINHAYAVWITVKTLKPTAIIESGVNAGQSTYFMRNASATAKIFAIDPEDKPICNQGIRWVDPTKNGYYYTGKKNFQDIQDIVWKKWIDSGDIQANNTLVFLDDHLSVFQRYSTFLQLGFRHIMLEDNYKIKEGATPGDKAGFTMKQMFHRVDLNTEFLFNQLISYTEFPPLVPPIMAKAYTKARKPAGGFMVASDTNTDIMAPILRPDVDAEDKARYEAMCKRFGINSTIEDGASYMQLMNYNQICYMELRPMSPYLTRKWRSIKPSLRAPRPK